MKHRTRSHSAALGAACTLALLLVARSAAAGPTASRTVRVDCSRGESVNAALGRGSGELVVEITGVCHEDVRVTRDRVTLRGSDPALDGLRGVEPASTIPNAVLRIDGADHVRVERLSIADGARNGVDLEDGSLEVTLVDCVISGNARDGLQVRENARGSLQNVVLSGNSRAGISGYGTGSVVCDGCQIDSSRLGVVATEGANLTLRNTTIAAVTFGAVADGAAAIALSDSALSGGVWAAAASRSGHLRVTRGTLHGDLIAEWKALMVLEQVTHTRGAHLSLTDVDSTLLARGGSLDGLFLVEKVGQVMLDGATLSGDLLCESGGAARCSAPGLVSGTVSGCGGC